MEASLSGQIALVTGGGRGVGRAIAEALAGSGATVVVAARTQAEIDATATEIGASGGLARAIATDVTDEEAVGALVTETVRAFGAPTLLVNAAGSWSYVGPLEDAAPERWWHDLEVSVRGTFLCTRAVLPAMLEHRAGRIVNLSSYAARAPQRYATGYAAAKAAVLRLSDSLAAELDGRGVLVFTISPGFVRTRLVEDVASSEAGRRYRSDLGDRTDVVEAEKAGRLVVQIARGRLDPLAGRFLHALDDVDEMLGRLDEIEANDLYRLSLRTLADAPDRR